MKMKTNPAAVRAACLLVALAACVAGASAQAPYSDGEVKGVERDARKVMLKTTEVKNIDMPPMTMYFHVKDAKMLDTLKVGDKVKFRAVNDAGKFTITEIAPAK